VWFKLKYATWFQTLRWISNLPIDFKPITPGLEIKYAIQEGEKAGAKITFAGREFDS